MKIYKIFEALEKKSPPFWTVTGTAAISLLGIVDYLTGNEITFSLFYLAPIVLLTWAVSRRAGLLASLLSALILFVAEIAATQTFSHPIVYIWNTLFRTVFYLIVTYLMAELQKARKEEQWAARTDFVSGAANARYFHELLQMEINRIRRYPHPITMVYLDIDNFKMVNDLFGHPIGDEVLRSIATELKAQLRKTDIIARLGGDEFALLLPSIREPEAQVVVSKVQTHLRQAMRQKNWPVTFSIGSVTCVTPPYSAEQLISMADELMYKVKNSTKNGFYCGIWDGKKIRKIPGRSK